MASTTNYQHLTTTFFVMPEVLDYQTATTTDTVEEMYVFVVQLIDGRFAIGHASNACLAICSANSGLHPMLPKSHVVKKIVGIKPVNEERTFSGTVALFCKEYGEDKVLAL